MRNIKRIAVLGLGTFGSALAKSLSQNGVEVIGIDKNMDHVREVMDTISYAVQADFTDLDQLREVGLNHCDIAVIASSQHLEEMILAIMNLENLGVKEIIVKSKNENHGEVLKRVGAHQVILPERDMALQMGQWLSQSSIQTLLAIDQQHQVIEFKAKEKWLGKTIQQVDFRKKYHVNIIAMRLQEENQLEVAIDPQTFIKENHVFIGITEDQSGYDYLQ